jgi:hypothetical protein
MPKRATTDVRPGPQKASRSVSGQAREKPSEDEMGEFEDAWEDEIEEDDGDDAAQGGDGTRIYRRCMSMRACVQGTDESLSQSQTLLCSYGC